jgi:UDP-N-acetylmuramyl tripeptide synthase
MTATLRRRPTEPRAGLTPRLYAALVGAKVAGRASRLAGRGGGTSLPGVVARRIEPDILDRLVRRPGVPVVAITGSNGKTTTARFTAALLRGEGVEVLANVAGSNLLQGVTSLAVRWADLRGRLPDATMLAEVDEAALPIIAREVPLRALLVADLFRDQLDRFGELYAVAAAIERVAMELPPDAALIANADDPLVATMAADRAGRRVTFGFDLDRSTDRITRAADTIRCPRCRSDLRYRHVYLSHMGAWSCPACGLERPPLDVAVTALELRGLEETRCTVRTPDGETTFSIPQVGVHIGYNAAAAIATLVGLGVPIGHAAASLAPVRPAFGRLESIEAGDRRIVLAFAKNPTSFNSTLHTLAAEGEPRRLVLALSNTLVDGEDFAWLWDVDFEAAVPFIEHVVASGRRADEVANRLKYAGLETDRIETIVDRRDALDRGLANAGPGGRLVVVAGYTPTIELREEMSRRGWVGRYWEG